jgi:hypothetical protein
MTFAPLQNVPQLDGSRYQSVNCGPANAAAQVRFQSYNQVTPTPMECRVAGDMGLPTEVAHGYTGLADVKRGVEAWADDFDAEGLAPPRLTQLGRITLEELLPLLVRRSVLVTMPIRYGAVLGSGLESDGDFRGGHFVSANRLYVQRKDGTWRRIRPYNLARTDVARLHSLVLDPLADGRWSRELGRRVYSGPQLWPVQLLAKAADAMSGVDGKFSAAVGLRAEEV